MKKEIENGMKNFFQEKSQSHVKKSRQSNIPKVAGQSHTKLDIINHFKKREKAKLL